MQKDFKDYTNRLRIGLDLHDEGKLENKNLKVLLIEALEQLQKKEADQRLES